MAVVVLFFSFLVLLIGVESQVIELDDSFTEKKLGHAWLVEFYAPWCGHCRQLEPVYHQVQLELRNAGIAVAKVDATRYSRLAADYDVRGYPTIKFIQGDRQYTHNGERTKEGIIEFAKRAYGPQIRPLSNQGKLYDARSAHADSVFFLYVGSLSAEVAGGEGQDESNKLYAAYNSLAEKFAVLSYFYSIDTKSLPEAIETIHKPGAVLVFKDKTFFEFNVPNDEAVIDSELELWVNAERFSAFPKLGGVGLNEMSRIGKRLVIVVTDEKDKNKDKNNIEYQKRVKDLSALVANEQRVKYHSDYQFAWLTDADTASNIVMSSVQVPFIFVLDPSNQQFYLPTETEDPWTVEAFTDFLDGVLLGNYEAHGGSGIGQRFKRLFYDIWSVIYGIYYESPWLALMVFGIPTFVIGIICYTLCCLEPMEDDGTMQESDEDDEDLKDGLEEPSPPSLNNHLHVEHSKDD